MTKEQQRELLTNYLDSVRDNLLSRSDAWPEDWDGFQLRWLAEQAFIYKAPHHNRMGRKRYREFKNDSLVNNLY